MRNAIAIIVLACPTLFASALGDLAASMQPDTWAALNTQGISTSTLLETGGSTGFITGDASTGCWDPVKQQAHFIGKGHNEGMPVTHAVYDAAANTWQRKPDPGTQTGWTASGGYGHGWDYGPNCDARGRALYRGFYGTLKLWKYGLDNGQWTEISAPSGSIMGYAAFIGTAFNPNRGTAGQIIACGAENGAQGVLMRYDVGTGTWARIAPSLLPGFVTSIAFAEYNETSRFTMFGGADAAAWKMDDQGNVTATAAFPGCVPYDNRNGIVHADPATGNFVMLCGEGTASWHIYNPVTDAWTTKASPSGIANHILSAPISSPWPTWGCIGIPVTDHGVIMYVKCNTGGCAVRLYKGGAFTPATRFPVMSQAPEFTASPNPFRTSVAFNLGNGYGNAELAVYNLKGERVDVLEANVDGEYRWRPDNLPCGVYVVRAEAAGRTFHKRITLLK